MQTQGVSTDGLQFNAGFTACIQATDAATMAAEVANAVAAAVLAQPTTVLIDIDIAGGGGGGAFMATLLMQTGAGIAPNEQLSQMTFKWFEALDPTTLTGHMSLYRQSLPAGAFLWAWDVSGTVGKWIGVFVTGLAAE
jgi:hypothetical protein